MTYTVILEKAERNWSAYAPDVPGCIATGPTPEATLAEFRGALEFHLESMRDDGDRIPEPSTLATAVTVELAARV